MFRMDGVLQYFEAFNKYLDVFANINRLNVDDIYLFAVSIKQLYDQKEFIEAINIGKILEPRLSNIEDEKNGLLDAETGKLFVPAGLLRSANKG